MNKLEKKYAPIVRAIRNDSQTEAVLKYLLTKEGQKNGITNLDAVTEKFNYCTRLSAVIFELRKKGVEIETVREPKKGGGTYGCYRVVA